MKTLERILLGIIIISAILNICNIVFMAALLTISCCSLAFAYLLVGITGIGKLLINLVAPRPSITNMEELSSDSIFPEKTQPNVSFFSPKGWKQKLATFFTTYCLSIMLLAILFRLNSWPSSTIMLAFSLAQSSLVVIISLILQISKPSIFNKQVLFRMASYAIACVLLLLLSPSFFIDIRYRNEPEKLREIKERRLHPQS